MAKTAKLLKLATVFLTTHKLLLFMAINVLQLSALASHYVEQMAPAF